MVSLSFSSKCIRRALVLFLFVATGAFGGTADGTYTVGVDTDNNSQTGCEVTLGNGAVIPGIEKVLIVKVDSQLDIPMVEEHSLTDCGGSPVVFDGGGWPVGLNNGTSGGDVIETWIPNNLLDGTQTVRLVFESSSASGSTDVVETSLGGGVVVGLPIPIPTLSQWALTTLVLLLLASAMIIMRKRRLLGRAGLTLGLFSAFLILIAAVGAGFTLDGQINDWSGLAPVAGDPGNDADPNDESIDILSVYAAFDDEGNLFFRFDVNDVQNDAPVAVDDQAVTAPGVPVNIAVLANDSDADSGDVLSVVAVSNPGNGIVELLGDNTINYTSNPGFLGMDTFTYTVADPDGEQDSATVSVLVSSENQSPTPLNDEATVQVNSTVTLLNSGSSTVLTNDGDPNGDILIVSTTPVSGPSHGTVTLNEDGTFSYTHDGSLKTGETLGTDSFTYQVCDDGTPSLCAEATVSITIVTTNNAPVGVDDTVTLDEDNQVTLSVLANDSDPDGDPLDLVSVFPQPGHSVVVTSGDAVTYRPPSHFNGTTTFTYSLRDPDGLLDNATVTVIVNPINDAPIAVADSGITGQDMAVNLDVLQNDRDVDGDALAVDRFTQGANGSVTSNPDGSLAYTPNPGFAGADSFAYVTTDGLLNSASVQVYLLVIADTTEPVLTDDEAGTEEDTPVGIDVLLNDVDFGLGPLVIIGVTQGGNGTVTFNEDGTITYFPAPGYVGMDTFTYTVVDADGNTYTGTVSVTVVEVNTAPTANDDLLAGAQNESIVGALLSNDYDPDPDDTLTIVTVFGAVHGTVAITNGGQAATFTPDAGFIGNGSFSYSIEDQDGLGDTAFVTVQVLRPNDIGVAIDDLAATLEDRAVDINVTANDRGVERQIQSIQVEPAHGTAVITQNNTVLYTPDAEFSGTDTFEYQLGGPLFGPNESDLGNSFGATVTITVTPVADPPTVVDDSVVTDEDVAATIDVLANDSDAEGDALTLTLVAQPIVGTTAIVNQHVVYTPAANWFGVDRFVYTVMDATGLTRSGNVIVTVNSVNDDPVADPQSLATDEETPLPVTLTATDVEMDSLSFSIARAPDNGVVTTPIGAAVTYTPNIAFNGTDTFEFQVDDGNGGIDTAEITIAVGAVNDAPVPDDQKVTVTEDGSVLITLTAFDKDGDTLTFAAATQPANGSLSAVTQVPPDSATLTYTPDPDFDQTDSFTFSVDDGNQVRNGTVSITVTAVNDPPEIDLDGATPGDGYSGVFNEGDGPVAAVNAATLTITDIDSDNLTSATAVLAAVPDGAAEVLAVNTTGSGISAVYAGGTLTLSGDAAVAVWQQVLRTLTYDNTSTTPDETARLITVTVNDGAALRTQLAPSNGAVSTINIGAVNSDPVANDDAYTVAEGDTLDINAATGVIANDTDPESAALTAVLDTNVSGGLLTFNPDGSFTYVHGGGEDATDSFTYHVNDGVNDSNIATVTLTVTPVNDAPVAVAEGLYKVVEGQTLNVAAVEGVLANDSDAENDPLTAVLETSTTHGVLTLNPDGSFSYAHDGGESTNDSFTYHANDGALDSNTVTVSLNISATNDAPVAVADGPYALNEGETLTVTPGSGVLTNDTDDDGDTLTAVLDTTTANGALTLNTDGSFSYVHNGSETTSDSFTYHAFDGNAPSNVVTVAINITAVNDAPVAVADGPYTVAEGDTLTVNAAVGLLINDSDAEGDALTAVLVSSPANGALTLNADGSFTYVHDGGDSSSDTFSYRANDGVADSSPATVSITVTAVNDAPVAVADAYTVDEGGTLSPVPAAGVLANDTDAESSALTAVLDTTTTNGSLTLNADGSFTYVHDGSETTSDSFTYHANDGSADSASTTVTLTITPVNDAPGAVADGPYTVNEGETLNVNAATGVLANDTDPEADTLTAVLDTDVTNGSLTLNADGSFGYTHDGSETTSDSFTYHARDGVADSTTVTVALTITPQNDAPQATADTYTVDEGGTLNPNAAAGVLANDTDAEGDALTAVLDTNVTNGSLTLNPDGSFSYTHNGSETTSDSFTYHANDGTFDSSTVTVTLTITPVNDSPVAVADAYTGAEGGTLTISAGTGVLANDSDPESGALTAVLDATTANGVLTLNPDGSFSYVHDGSETTSDSFTYHANDGAADSSTVTVTLTITPVNDAPVAVSDGPYTVAEGGTLNINSASGVLANDSDAENDALTAVLDLTASNGSLTLNPDGSFAYTHNGGETTSDSFTYHANDGAGNSSTVTVSITVTPVNDPPMINSQQAIVIDEDTSITLLLSMYGVTDPDNTYPDDFTLEVLSGPDYAVVGTTVTPAANFSGFLSVQVRVNDGQADSNTWLGNIVVNPINDGPVIDLDGDGAGTGFAATFTEDGGAVNITDTDVTLVDNDSVNLVSATATLNTIPDGAFESLAVNTAGTTIVPNYDDATGVLTLSGSDTIENYRNVLATLTYNNTDQDPDATTRNVSVVCFDGFENGTTAVAVVTVVPVNDAPVAVADAPPAVDEGDTLVVNTVAKMGLGVLDNDTDSENDTLTAVLDTDVTNGSLTLNPNGTFSYTHDGSETTTDSFTYHANDGALDSNTVTVSITINPVNDLPVANATADTVDEGNMVTITLTGSDAEGSALTFSAVGAPANGSLGAINQVTPTSATVVYTHDGSETTSDSFTFNVNDGTADGASAALVSITVNPVNDAPVANATAETLDEGDMVTITLTGSDAEGSALTFSTVSGPTNGSLGAINQVTPTSATVVYTHDGSETTSDSFTFRVNDGTTDSLTTATVSITVNPVNDLPVANAAADTVDEGDMVTITLTGSDAEGSMLTFSAVSGPTNGSLGAIMQATSTSATVVYTHDGGETTSDSFTFRVNDGTADSATTATVSITVNPVNDLPTVSNGSDSVDEGMAVVITLVGADVDGDTLTFSTVSGPTNGSLGAIVNATATTATVTYTHDGSETTTDTFTFRANDGTANSATNATVSITINPINDTPVADAGADTVNEGDMVTITLTGSDAEGSALTFAVASAPTNGSLGAVNQLTPTSASVVYTHDGGETTSDAFTFTVNDGTVTSTASTVSITVNPVNDVPTVSNGSETVNEGDPVVITLVGADADGDTLTFSTVSGPTNGSLGAIVNATATTATVTYTHDGSETTTDSFTFKVNDGTVDSATNATVSITITPVNDTPVANAVADTVNEGDMVTITLTGSDAEGSALTFAVASGPSNGSLGAVNQLTPTSASVVYTHNGGETTSDSFTYTVNDGSATSTAATASITVNPVNDLPVANAGADSVNEGDMVTITLTGSDAEGSALTFSVVSGPTNGSLGAITPVTNSTATVVYTHDGSETTMDSFTFKVNDGTADSAANATFSITVNPVNDTPVATADTAAVDQGMAVGITLSGSDAEGSALTFAVASGPTNGSLGMITQLTPTTASVTYTHDNSLTTTDSFTFTVNDGTATSTAATISISITLANIPPVATDDTFKTVSNTRLEVGVADTGVPAVGVTGSVRDNDTDTETATNMLTITGTSNVTAGASVTMNADGTFHYTPPPGRTTDDTFDYTLSDGIATDTGTVTIQFFNQVWYVDNEAAAGGLGTSGDPFDTLAEAETAADAGDFIYIDNGDGSTTGMTGGITLADNQILHGSGAALVVNVDGSNETLQAAGTAPTITNTGGPVIALEDGNTITGVNITAGNGAGILGSSDGGTTTIANTTITTSGANDGISLTGQTGTFSFDGTINGSSTGDGVSISSSSAAFTFNDLNVSGQDQGVLLSGNTGGSFSFTGTTTVGSNTTAGLNITGDNTGTTDSSVTIASLAASLSSGTGLAMTNYDGTAAFTAGSLANSAGRVVDLNNVDVTVDFSNLTFSGSSFGVAATGCAGTISFPDFTVAAGSTVNGVSLTSNTGGTFNFNTVTATGLSNVVGFLATGGGTVNITDTDSAISTTGATALELNGVAIGGSNMTFASLSASSTGNNEGIDIDSVTGGTLSVTGTTTVNTTTGSFPGIDINGSSATFTFATLDIDSTSGQGVSLQNNTGSVTMSAGDITGSTLAAFDIDQGNAAVTYSGTINNSSGRAVEVTNRTGGTVTFGGAITDSTGAGSGLLIQNNSSGSPVINFNGLVTLNTGSTTPATISTNTGATVSFANIDFDTSTGIGFAASSTGTVNVTAGTVNTTNAEVVNINNCGQGITFTSVTGANSAGSGVNLSTNTGTITFNGLDITNTGGTGFLASNAGAIAIAGSSNDIATTTGIGVSISNSTIAGNGSSGGINLQSVSSSGAANGILLNNTGTGRFVVTGDGSTAGSGGTIQTITNNGVELRSCNNISLSYMNLTNANTTDNCGTEAYDETGSENCRGAIYMNTVTEVTFDNLAINGTTENGITGVSVTDFDLTNSTITNAGNSTSESAINIRDLLGTAADSNTNTISGCTITNSAQIGIFIRNLQRTNAHSGDYDRLEITNTTVTQSGDNTAADNITISLRDDASNNGSNMQVIVSGCTLTGTNGEITDAIQFDTGINAKGDFQISTTETNNCNTGINISGANSSTTTFLVNNNTDINADGGQGVNIACNGTATMSGTVSNNTIDSFNANNPGFGIDAVVDATGTLTIDIDSNNVTDFSIPVRAGARNSGTGTANISITDNTMSSGGGFAFGVLWVFSGNGSGGESNSVCANISGNNFNDPFGTQEYYIEQYSGNTLNLQGYSGSATSQSAIQTFLEGNNVAGDALVETCCGTSTNVGNATCTTPSFGSSRGR